MGEFLKVSAKISAKYSVDRTPLNPCEILELRILVALKTRQQIYDIVILLI